MTWHHINRHKICVVSNALAVIETEAHAARKTDKERGGSLVGLQNADVSVILYAIPTGPNAQTSWGQITTDAAFQTQHVRAISDHYRHVTTELVYLADYHVHQMGLSNFSEQDRKAFGSILFDPDHDYLRGLPVILATFQRGAPVYLPYWITRAGQSTKTEVAYLEIVRPDDAIITKSLRGCTYTPLEEIMASRKLPAVPPHVRDHLAEMQPGDMLMTRLTLEATAITAVFSVKPQLRRTRSGYPCLVAQVSEYQMFAVIPSEFPLNPATIFFRKSGGTSIEEFITRRTWNSIARIADVFEELIEATAGTPEQNTKA